MKLLPVLALALIVSSTLQAAPATPSPEIQQLMQEGQAAFNKGDYAAAKSAFDMVYQLDARNQLAINYLVKIKALERGAGPVVNVEQQLSKLIVPKVMFKEATIGSVFDYLRNTATKLSGGKVVANFVLSLPEEQVKTQTVTLSMTDAPFTEVVKYVAKLSNVTVQYERHAIVVSPRTVAAPAPVGLPETVEMK